MDYIAINKINCFADISEKEFIEETLIEKIEKLKHELKSLLSKYNIDFESIETFYLNKNKYSIVKCENCNHLMIDRETNPVKSEIESIADDIIYDGAKFLDKYLCEDCLPKDHRWST
jgi:hypothetical protein